MKSFDQAAKTYESFGFIQREMTGWLAEWLPLRKEGTAIEIGAGTGFFTERLLPWNGKLLVTDASTEMVAGGAKRRPQLHWEVARADDLPDVSADWIFSSSFLQWAEEPVELLRHWKTRLVPNGRILAGFFAAPTLPELGQVLPECAPLQWRFPKEWETHVAEAGFVLERTEIEKRVFIFRSALELLRTLHGVGAAPVSRVSGATLRRAIDAYDVRFACKRGVWSTWTFYRVEAVNKT